MLNKTQWSLRMATEQEARKAIQDSAKAFYVLAAIQAVLAFRSGPRHCGTLAFWLSSDFGCRGARAR